MDESTTSTPLSQSASDKSLATSLSVSIDSSSSTLYPSPSRADLLHSSGSIGRVQRHITTIEYLWVWLQIFVLPYVLWGTYIFYPFQKPQKGLANNWAFMFLSMPFGALCVISVYAYWGKVFLGKIYYAPVAVTSGVLVVLYWLICQFIAFPVTLLGLLVIVVLTVCFPITLLVCIRLSNKKNDPHTSVAFKSFSLFRIMVASLFAMCCAYVVLFNHFQPQPVVQRILVIAFTVFVFVLKLFVQDFARRSVPFQYSSLVVFYLEFFYEFFSLSVFPDISSLATYIIIVILKVVSMGKSIILLTDQWWAVRNKALEYQRYMEDIDEKEATSSQNSNNNMELSVQRDFSFNHHRKTQLYKVIRRIVFSDLDHEQLRNYISLNFFYSCIVHVLCPLYWIPMSYFLKHGYNSPYFTYHFISNSDYEMSLIYAGISFGVSVLVIVTAYFIVLKKFKIDFVDVSKPFIVEDKWFFILAIISTFTICWSMASEQHNIAWYFVRKN